MKNKALLFIGILGVIVIVTIFFIIIRSNNAPSTGVDSNPKQTVSEISLNTKQFINQLENVKIKGTNDSVMITKKVKWEVPEHEAGTTVSFSIAIPYTIIIEGHEYKGVYQLNNSDWSTSDNNPKYDFKITNLTKDGDIEVLVENKR